LKLLYVPVYFTHFSIVANQFSVLNCAFFIVVFIVFYISAYFFFYIKFVLRVIFEFPAFLFLFQF